MIPTEPGVYDDVEFADYLAIDAESNTRLGQLNRSPLHYHTRVGSDPKAKHLVLGELTHVAILEPAALAERFVAMPDFHLDEENCTSTGRPSKGKVTNYVKEKTEEFERVNGDKTIVPLDWYREMKAMHDSIHSHPLARKLLYSPGRSEVTLVWRDETGLLCKGRIDRTAVDHGAFVDLKTTADLSKFPTLIARYGYHRQAAHYQAGWAALNDGELLTPWIVAVEKQHPYCTQIAPLDDDAIYEGLRQRRRLMRLLADCRAKNEWPGPESPRAWRIPAWATEPVELTVNGEAV